MAETTSAGVPDKLGRYLVVRRLGAGGMAEVFLAKSTGAEGIEKMLVVKRVLPSFARSTKFITMFLEEAKIATRLNHPNIVQVYAFEQVRNEFLLAMEFVDGLDVGRLVAVTRRAGETLPFGITAFIVQEVAKGLDYAHKRKDEHGDPMEIVHRDVSPQNVLLSYDGTVKLADFGIAKARMVSEETGVIKGKFTYMSPEQARGERVDGRSDVFALGVLFSEMLMGRTMYPGHHGLDILEKVRKGEFTLPDEVNPDIPPELAAIVRRALAFDREERYQTARSFSGALGQYLHMLDEVQDAEVLERFIGEVVPREDTTSGGARRPRPRRPSAQTDATVASAFANAERELRERRHVVVVSGSVRAQTTQASDDLSQAAVGGEAARVLADIAYKADAVLSWPDGAGMHRFRLTLGLGRATVHDPLQAMRLSLDVIEAMNGLSADMLVPITASLGVSRGVVSTVRDRNGRLLRYEPVGAVLDVADRLAAEGCPSEVLVAGEVYRLVRRAFSFDEDGPREVDVVSDPGVESTYTGLRAYCLRGARTREQRAAEALVAPEGLVGRQEQMRSFVEAYREVATERHNVFLAVSGELGVGKTCFTAAAIAALDPPPRVLHAECAFGASDVPYATLTELVRAALDLTDDTTPEESIATLEHVAAELLPDEERRGALVQGLSPLLAPNEGEPFDMGAGDRSQMIVGAARLMLGAMAAQGPLLVWADALQWCDGPSLELMSTLIGTAYDVPLMAVFCTRPEGRAEQLLSMLPHIVLGELPDAARRQLLRARFGNADVPGDIERAIVERAGGNPFFICELVDSLIDRGAVTLEGDESARRVVRNADQVMSLPTTLEGVIAARLDELSEQARETLRWLAVLGPGFTRAEISAVAGEEATEHLDAIEARGFIQRDEGIYTFPSAVIRHVAYESCDDADLLRMHKRVGGWLGTEKVGLAPARVARHLEKAGQVEEAADAYLHAAAAAQGVYSNREALRFFGRALGLLPGDAPNRFYAHEAREQILRGLGQKQAQMQELEAMRAFAERARDPALLALAFNRIARHEIDSGRTAGVAARLERALSAAIQASDRGAEVEALRLEAELARESADVENGLAACDRALVRCGLDEELLSARATVLALRAMLLRLAGRMDEARAPIAEAFVIFRRLGLKRHEAQALSTLAIVLYSLGAWEDAVAAMRASLAVDLEIGDRMHLGRKLSNIGQLAAEMGDYDTALEFLRRADEVFERIPDDVGQPDALCGLAEVLIEGRFEADAADDRLDMANKKLDAARRIATRTGDRYDQARERIVRAALARARGDLDGAEQSAREGCDIAGPAGIVVYELLAEALRAELLAKLDRGDEALSAVDRLLERLEKQEVVERAERVHLALARALETLGDSDRSARALARARDVVEGRLSQIRDDAIRDRYLQSPLVCAIQATP